MPAPSTDISGWPELRKWECGSNGNAGREETLCAWLHQQRVCWAASSAMGKASEQPWAERRVCSAAGRRWSQLWS